MTTVGHSSTGITLSVLTLPRAQSLRWYILTGVCFVVFASFPVFPLPGWGHSSYRISHSIFVTFLLVLLLLWPTFQARMGRRVITAWSAAWLSQMVLDSMYGHGQGIAIS